jgi:phage anti-repressor protein
MTAMGRDVHEYFGLARDFSDWIQSNLKRARMVENRDYEVSYDHVGNSGGGRPRTEYVLTLDCAKHICMLSETERGFEAREYFIGCERRAEACTQKLPAAGNQLDFLQGMLDALRQNDDRLTRVEQSQSKHREQLSDVRVQIEDLRSDFDKRIAELVEKPVKEKPAGTESMTGAKARITLKTGAPGWVTEEVLTQLEAYKIEPKAYVARGNRHNPDGSIVLHADGTPVEAEPYFVFQIGMVTRRMSEFLSAAERHPTDKRKATHPALPGKPFKLNAGLAKGER